MLRDVTIGQYYPADSPIHRLDPRTKLLATVVFIVMIFVIKNWAGYAAAGAALLAVIHVSTVPLKYILKGLKAIFVILIFTAVLNLFLTPGEAVFSWRFIHITREGIVLAVRMAVRLIYLIVGSSVMTLTTTPNQLTDGMETGLAPLKKLHVPVHEIAMMMSIALRFIPILMEETDKIIKAQQARCADFESGNILQRAKSLVPVLVPLFISSFRRANDLAMAMEARCYHGGEGRTRMHPLRYARRDRIAYILLVLFVALLIVLNIIL